ncbi:LutB/LldF family L-lactate oxidation iron-sulfur protein [Gracilimonas mengyeensis]|uniref:L-lactate dehydrogenase complex protein LldF n=1 Tax=Gracilimonas mengyeensis TaxID=1302730 RepID=A0A521C4B3_9BACT|nr:LutB/LldF family L-lactate oxidation iron-sulfur protein [Gracilimonas mengyeensis]SMO54175.1 L-lactate dehydrogenase complex protein LldF [Gracilimonas mengyeensis]
MSRQTPTFQETADAYLNNTQLRENLGHATHTIRDKRADIVGEMPDWEHLREAGNKLKKRVMRHLDSYLLQLEASVQEAGGHVHWARDAEEANDIITGLVKQQQVDEVVKVKSITTDEIKLNEALKKEGIQALETDLAELIVQLAEDEPSHILVPAIHKNRKEIRDLFREKLNNKELTDRPEDLAEAARLYLRKKFLSAKVGISGANFGVADTGTIAVVESEGNGRMCTTLPETLITVMGIEKLIPTWQDFEVFMQLLPRSSTAERMNPYNSFWTGVTPGDGPQEFHLVLLDNGRTNVLADEVGRQTLNCIRCSACLNVCPVYERTGGHAYHSVYPGPIGAILTPQLKGIEDDGAASLPYASSLCGACYEVCPVKIDIPKVLVHLRGKIVDEKKRNGSLKAKLDPEHVGLKLMAQAFKNSKRYERAQKLAQTGQNIFVKDGKISSLPGYLSGWSAMRDLKPIPKETFREWWRNRNE